MKIAADEGLWETEDPASFAFVSIANQKEQREVWSLRVPYVTSILMYNRPYGEVRGINDLQKSMKHNSVPVHTIQMSCWFFIPSA